jgi:polysaccharide deacetylase family protein (PEP-CTERM system associated)
MRLSEDSVMTIDVEDWYQSSLDLFRDSSVAHGTKPEASVVDNTYYTLDLLSKTGNKATFFVLGTVAEHYPDIVKEILKRGHEVGTHGYFHKLVYNMTPCEFEDDVRIGLEYLDKAGCSQILGYRAPYWSITKKSLWALDILQKLGLKYDSSIFPIRRGLYGIHDADPNVHQIVEGFWEFPPATIRMLGVNWPIAGGGYLRMVPYRIVASAIRRSSARRIMIFYFHPYELDPKDTHLKHRVKSAKSVAYWIQQVIGRRSNPDKLKKLLYEFKFTSIKECLLNLQTYGQDSPNADIGHNRRR